MTDVQVRVHVPATSANLGPGFDALGLALDLWDEVEVDVSFEEVRRPIEIEIEVDGVGADFVPRDERHLIVRTLRTCFTEHEIEPRSLRLRCHNRIPHSRGLGSSAAAIVAGVLAAQRLGGVDDVVADDVLATAARIEGHPDNVAPCVLGGLTVAWNGDDGRARASRSEPHPDLAPVVLVPEAHVPTKVARGLIPATVPHADAARNAGRAALLMTALTREPGLLMDATEDWLHQQYREPAMPGTIELVSVLRKESVAAVVSGAGPSILVLATKDQIVPEPPAGWSALHVATALRGAYVG